MPPVAINYRGPNPPDPLRRVAPTYPHPSFAGSFPSFAGPDRRISHCQGHQRLFLPRATQYIVRQGQIRAILPLGGCCRAQNGVLVCPGNEKKASREQIRLFLCPARTHFRPVLPAESAGLRLSKQKNACPAAPCRLICLQHLRQPLPTHGPRTPPDSTGQRARALAHPPHRLPQTAKKPPSRMASGAEPLRRANGEAPVTRTGQGIH